MTCARDARKRPGTPSSCFDVPEIQPEFRASPKCPALVPGNRPNNFAAQPFIAAEPSPRVSAPPAGQSAATEADPERTFSIFSDCEDRIHHQTVLRVEHAPRLSPPLGESLACRCPKRSLPVHEQRPKGVRHGQTSVNLFETSLPCPAANQMGRGSHIQTAFPITDDGFNVSLKSPASKPKTSTWLPARRHKRLPLPNHTCWEAST